jgi:hypothetical protein
LVKRFPDAGLQLLAPEAIEPPLVQQILLDRQFLVEAGRLERDTEAAADRPRVFRQTEAQDADVAVVGEEQGGEDSVPPRVMDG